MTFKINCFIICIVLLLICIFLIGTGNHTQTQAHLVLINSNCLKHYPFYLPLSEYQNRPNPHVIQIQFNLKLLIRSVSKSFHVNSSNFTFKWLKFSYRNLMLKLKRSMQNSKSQNKQQNRKFEQLFCNIIIFRNRDDKLWIVCKIYSRTIIKHWNILMNYEIYAIVLYLNFSIFGQFGRTFGH